jgi:chemotaxis protein MotA
VDIATIIGFVLAFLAIVGSIALTGLAPMYIDIKSIMVVVFGSIAVVFISFPLGNLLKLPNICKHTIFTKPVNVEELITQLVGFAEIARRDGILSLENHMQDVQDDFIIRGIQMAVDGTDPELIEAVLETDLENIDARHDTNKKILDAVGRYAPAFGMIGTLIGLVAMLGDMSDPSGIGAGMAVALLTTLYGAIIANAIFLPMADKLQLRHDEEMVVKTIIVKGVMSIQAGDNPRVVAQKLQTFIPASQRASEDDAEDGMKKAA